MLLFHVYNISCCLCLAVYADLCTKWPVGLETDENCDSHFPLTVTTQDYIADGVSVRDARARQATIKVSNQLYQLKLFYCAELE